MNIIVGIDPGTTTGIAIIDLNKRIISSQSKKGASPDEIIAFIESCGTPVLVACDVSHIPSTVKKVAASFNVDVYVPKHDIPITEKTKLTKQFGIKNPHERDALAAAFKAYETYKPKIIRAKKIAEKKKEELIAAAFKRIQISEKAKRLLRVAPSKKSAEPRQKMRVEHEKVLKKDKDMSILKQYIRKLENENKLLKQDNKKLEHMLKNKIYEPIDRDRYIKQLKHNLNAKNREIKALEKEIYEIIALFNHVVHGSYKAVKKAEKGQQIIKDFGAFSIVKEKEHKQKQLSAGEVEELFQQYRKYRR